ncbi:SCO family protein [Verrucomicrobiota bacterium sgz303538]
MKPLFLATLLLSAALGFSGCERNSDSPLVAIEPPPGLPELQPLWSIPDFKLTERNAQPVSLGDLKGKVWIADFFYTTCPGPCPMMTSRLSDLHKDLKGEADVRFVSISTDPSKDTPEVLKQYADRFGASERWLFLTGDKQQIFKLANEGFKLNLVEDPKAEEPITHSTKLVLVDRTGTVRGFYEGIGEEDTKRIVKHVRRLLDEKP